MISPVALQWLTDRIKRHEGFRAHTYRDTERFLTIGYGHKIDGSRKIPIPMIREYAEKLLERDIANVILEINRREPWLAERTTDEARRSVFQEMGFQLGVSGMLKFKNALLMYRHGNYEEAARAILDSKMATQTPNRAKEYARIMRTGEW